MIFVTIGSLDNPEGIDPALEMFTKRRLKWANPLDLPQFENMPSCVDSRAAAPRRCPRQWSASVKGFGRRPSERGADNYDNYDSRHPKPFTYLAASGVRVIPDAEVQRGPFAGDLAA